jgi:phenylacetate-CoA ligase
MNVDLCPIRIVDGEAREVPLGEPGEVVVSNLVNRGTVVLNYRLGDLAAQLPGPCRCGRALPMLSDVQGRRTDWLETRSGSPIHPQMLRNVLRSVDGVRRFQLVQEKPGEVRVIVVIAPHAARDAIRARIVDDVRGLDAAIGVDVEFAENLPRTKGGKVRTTLRHEASAE